MLMDERNDLEGALPGGDTSGPTRPPQREEWKTRLSAFRHSRLAREGGWSIGLRIAYTGLIFLTTALLARVLGAEGYGIYAYAYALAMLCALPAQAGLPALVMRETARGMERSESGQVRGIWRWANRVALLLSLVLLLGGLLFVGFDREPDIQTWTIIWALVLVPPMVLGNLRGAALRGLHRVVAGQLPDFFVRPGLFLLLLAGYAFVLGRHLSPSLAMGLHVLAAVAAFAFGGWLLRRSLPPLLRRARPAYRGRAWLKSTVPLALLAGMQVINQQADLILLGLFKPVEQVGVYQVAVQIAKLSAIGLIALEMVVAPRFASLYARGDRGRLQKLVTLSARAMLGISLLVTLFLVGFGKLVLEYVFGSEYGVAYLPLLVLLAGQLVNAMTGAVGQLLNMSGHEQATARGMAVAALVNVGLNLVLIPPLGVLGAAVATATSLIVWNALLWGAVYKRLKIRSFVF